MKKIWLLMMLIMLSLPGRSSIANYDTIKYDTICVDLVESYQIIARPRPTQPKVIANYIVDQHDPLDQSINESDVLEIHKNGSIKKIISVSVYTKLFPWPTIAPALFKYVYYLDNGHIKSKLFSSEIDYKSQKRVYPFLWMILPVILMFLISLCFDEWEGDIDLSFAGREIIYSCLFSAAMFAGFMILLFLYSSGYLEGLVVEIGFILLLIIGGIFIICKTEASKLVQFACSLLFVVPYVTIGILVDMARYYKCNFKIFYPYPLIFLGLCVLGFSLCRLFVFLVTVDWKSIKIKKLTKKF